jgi:hypothetical protein
VPRGVDDVHSVPVPLAPHARTLNRDAYHTKYIA